MTTIWLAIVLLFALEPSEPGVLATDAQRYLVWSMVAFNVFLFAMIFWLRRWNKRYD